MNIKLFRPDIVYVSNTYNKCIDQITNKLFLVKSVAIENKEILATLFLFYFTIRSTMN